MKALLLAVALLTLLATSALACGVCTSTMRCVASWLPFGCVSVCDADGCTCHMMGGCEGGIFYSARPVREGGARQAGLEDARSPEEVIAWCQSTPGCTYNAPAADHATKSWGMLKTLYR